jgi:hypothetical protein
MSTKSVFLGAFALLAVLSTTSFIVAQEPPEGMSPEAMMQMMEKARKFTQPGEHHKLLERFIGTWDTETRFPMGGSAYPPEKGVSETAWLIEGRWLKSAAKGTMMGQPMEAHMIMGYDNFKMSYVVTYVSSMDTAMLRSEGDLDPGGKVLITYGTLDEYLTGEHDKMVKYVWRFESDDKVVMEIHDLPIGEKNTKVVEIVSTRRK